MSKKCMVCVSLIVLLAVMCSVQAVPMRYDFEPSGTTPTAGYTHVDETTMYSAAQGYGFEDVDETAQYGQDYIDVFTGEAYGISNNTLTMDAVSWTFPWTMTWFIVDLPNGDYQITLGNGGVTYNRTNQDIVVEGIVYDFSTPAGGPLYTLDVKGDNWIKSAPVEGDYGRLKTLGYNNTGGANAEILLLENELVTIADGQLNIGAWGAYPSLTFLEIVPEPATIALLGLGGLLLRRRR
mgnify:CR=1 FL=1